MLPFPSILKQIIETYSGYLSIYRPGLGARFSKAPETFRARKAIFRSSVSENGEVYI